MMRPLFAFFFILFLGFQATAQTALLQGKITDDEGRPIDQVIVELLNSNTTAQTDSLGNFALSIPAGKKVNLKASLFGYEPEPFSVTAKEGDTVRRNIYLTRYAFLLDEATVRDERYRGEVGSINMNTQNVDLLPSAQGGLEAQIKVLVGTNNELTSQYTVRGGNFDENLVYVNDFEINRPFLVRSGQQEGLSFVNSDLVSNVLFSVGGFPARYGDKLSSVLDVSYKRPKGFSGSVMASLLGFQAHVAGSTKSNRFTYLLGFRQKSNQYLLQAQPTKGQYNPSFTDVQGLLNFKITKKLEMDLLGNYALNRFRFQPESSRTAFGSWNQAMAFRANYLGQENDKFENTFAGLSFTYRPNDKLKLKVLGSYFLSDEREAYDIYSEYQLSLVEIDRSSSEYGNDIMSLGSGAIHRFARNFLNASVLNGGLRANYDAGRHYFSFGTDVSQIRIEDRLMEWERRDSAGFSVPFDPFQVNMYERYKANNAITNNKIAAFLQDNILLSNTYDMVLSLGVRATYTTLNKELLWSPRMNLSFNPKWKRDVIFKLAAGMYAQPPFYREMRALDGSLNTALKAQRALHFALGADYNFIAMGNRPFKITGELYYKKLWNLVPYEYDDVRIRYAANNNARGYAYGGEVRIFGDLVKDAESWISVGYLKTMEQTLDELTGEYSAFRPRPTDQRLMFGVFFSDYLPQNKNFKVYLNMMYATGLPVSSPDHSFKTYEKFRLPDYKRVDIGFSALLMDGVKNPPRAYSLFKGIKSIWASLEVFNLLGISNTLSYEYIRSQSGDLSFYIPNRLTSRLVNLKLIARF